MPLEFKIVYYFYEGRLRFLENKFDIAIEHL